MFDVVKEVNSVWLIVFWNEYKIDVVVSCLFDESNFDEDMDVYLVKM